MAKKKRPNSGLQRSKPNWERIPKKASAAAAEAAAKKFYLSTEAGKQRKYHGKKR